MTLEMLMEILSKENEKIIGNAVSHDYQTERDGLTRPKMEELLTIINEYECEECF